MASKWAEVYQSEKFQERQQEPSIVSQLLSGVGQGLQNLPYVSALSAIGRLNSHASIDEQQAVKKAYFDKYVLPQIKERGDNPKTIWKAFSEKYSINKIQQNKSWGQRLDETIIGGLQERQRKAHQKTLSEQPVETRTPEEIWQEQRQQQEPSIVSQLLSGVGQGLQNLPYVSALSAIGRLNPQQPQQQPQQQTPQVTDKTGLTWYKYPDGQWYKETPSGQAGQQGLERPLVDPVDLLGGAAFGAKMGAKMGLRGLSLAKNIVREAGSEFTLGTSDIATGIGKGIVKVASKSGNEAVKESYDFIQGLSKHLNKTDEQRIAQEVAKGVDDTVKKLPFGKMTGFKEKIIDDWQRVKELARTKGLALTSDLDPRERRKLFFKRQAVRLADTAENVQNIDKEILQTAKSLKIDDKELQKTIDSYLIARHAPERNAKLGEKATPVTTSEAYAIQRKINLLPHSGHVKKIANDIQRFHNKTLDILYADGQPWGVIDKATYNTLKKTYPNHIPLNRVMNEDDMIEALMGKGLEVKGSGLQAAKGSTRKIKDIMENVYSARTQAIKRIEKNIVDNETYNFASDYIKSIPGQELFEFQAPKAIGKSFDGRILYSHTNDPHILQFRRMGMPVWLKINDSKLASAFRGINREQLPGVMKFLGTITRYMSAMATRFNPEFPLSNKIRDLQEAMVYMASKKNIGFTGALGTSLRDPASGKAIVDFLRGKDTKGARLYKELRLLGGAGEGIALSTKQQVGESLANIRKLNRSKSYKSFKKIANGIDHWNLIFEDSTRLSAYKQALANGLSKDKAAIIAKEASIDFDQMGIWGPVVNSLWMFSNASLQGSTKMLRAMRNPKIAAAVVGSMGASVFAVNKYNDSADSEWRNKVSDWDRLNGLNVVISKKDFKEFDYITIPVSWGLKPIKIAMEYASDIAYGQDLDLATVSGQVLSALVEGYNPTGGVDIVSTVTPSFAKPFVDIARGQTWYGGKTKPEKAEKEQAESTRYFKSLEESTIGRGLIAGTKAISDFTGNRIEISPSDIDYFLKQITGGPGRFSQKVFNTIAAISKGEKPNVRDIPFVSRVKRSIPEEQFKANDEDITYKLRGIQKEKFYLNKGQDKLFNALEKNGSQSNINLMNKWIQMQPDNKKEYLENRFKRFIDIKDIDRKNWKWWMGLAYTRDPKAQAMMFYNKYKKLDNKDRKELKHKLGRLDSTQQFNFGNKFWAEFNQLER